MCLSCNQSITSQLKTFKKTSYYTHFFHVSNFKPNKFFHESTDTTSLRVKIHGTKVIQLSSSLSLQIFFSFKLSISIGSQKALKEFVKAFLESVPTRKRSPDWGSLYLRDHCCEALDEREAIWFLGQCPTRLDHQVKLFFPNALSTLIQILIFIIILIK